MFADDELPYRPALEGLLKRIALEGGTVSSIRELQAEFDPAWAGVAQWVKDVTPMLERAIRALSAITDPSAIVFGGEAPRLLQDMLIKSCAPFGTQPVDLVQPARPVLLNSQVAGDPATFGAALLPIKQSVLR